MGGYFINISAYEVWEVRAGFQVSRREFYTNINLNYAKIEFMFCIKNIIINKLNKPIFFLKKGSLNKPALDVIKWTLLLNKEKKIPSPHLKLKVSIICLKKPKPLITAQPLLMLYIIPIGRLFLDAPDTFTLTVIHTHKQ